jgi:CheY-like chemotaxis protein
VLCLSVVNSSGVNPIGQTHPTPLPLFVDSGISVLVAEDDQNDAFILQRAFKECGLQRPPHVVHDGIEAIEYMHGDPPFDDRILHPFPNILILDLKMPRASGFDVLQWINQHPDYRVIPTIVLSASADRRDVKHAFCLGAHAYLCKPGSYNEFTDLIRRLLSFWELCQKPGVEPVEPECDTLKATHPIAGARFR